MRYGLAALAVATIPHSGLAQDAAECVAVWDRVVEGLDVSAINDPLTLTDEGWCEVRNVALDSGQTFSTAYLIDAVRWRGVGLDRFAETLNPPTAIDLQLRGIDQYVALDDPVMEYLIRALRGGFLTNATIDLDLSLAWDVQTRVLDMSRLYIDFPGDNAISVTTKIANLDLTSFEAMENTMLATAITSLTADIESNGLFESFFLMPLAMPLLEGAADPAAAIVELKRYFTKQVDTFSPAIFVDPSRDALRNLVADMPNPAGRLTLQLDAPAGFGASLLQRYVATSDPVTMTDVWDSLVGVTVAIDYIRTLPTPE
jgi:hypothetical protein